MGALWAKGFGVSSMLLIWASLGNNAAQPIWSAGALPIINVPVGIQVKEAIAYYEQLQ